MNGQVNHDPCRLYGKAGPTAPRMAQSGTGAGCILGQQLFSKDFADYIKYWKHNGFWFFDSPGIIQQLAQEHSIDLGGTSLFYYEVHELEFMEDENRWEEFEPEPSYTTLNDQYCLRIAIANHRSTQADFDLLAKEVVRIGKEITAQPGN